MEVALAVLAFAIFASGRRDESSRDEAPVDEPGPQEGTSRPDPGWTAALPGALGTVGGIVGKVGGLASGAGGAAGAAKGLGGAAGTTTGLKGGSSTLATAVAVTVGGVSAGFLVVAGLWAVALVAGIVFGKLMAPEMDRRRTLARLYSCDEGSFAWTAGRLFWANLVVNRLPGTSVVSLTWPSLSTEWGELRTLGSLPVVVGFGLTSPPPTATDAYPEDQYAVYAWPASRPAPDGATAVMVDSAHLLSRVWVNGMVAAAVAAGAAGGDQTARLALSNPTTARCPLLVPMGNEEAPSGMPSLLSSWSREMAAANATNLRRGPSIPETRAAWLEGFTNGLELAKRTSFGFGGKYLLEGQAGAVARDAAALASPEMKFGSQGAWLTVEGVLVYEVKT